MPPPWKLVPPGLFSDPKVIEYQNTKGKLKYQKVIDYNDVIGYTVVPGTARGSPIIRPIYRGQIYLQPYGGKDFRTQYIFDTFRTGDRLNGYNYDEDPIGCELAQIAAVAVRALEALAHSRKATVRPKKQTTAKKPRKRKKA